MKRYIKSYKLFESDNTPKTIDYRFEHINSYSGQHNYELGAYIDNNIVGLVEYVLYDGELTISDVVVLPKYRRMGIGSRMMRRVKDNHPEYVYRPSMKTDLGGKFIHKEIDDLDHIQLNESYVNKFNFEIGNQYKYDDLPDPIKSDIDNQFEDNYDESIYDYVWEFKLMKPSEIEEYVVNHFGEYDINDVIDSDYVRKLTKDIEKNGLDYPAVGIEGNHRALVHWILKKDLPYLNPIEISENLYETKSTHSDILDLFSDRIGSFDLDNNIQIRIERTKGSYKVIAIDKLTNKSIGRIYIQEIKKKKGGGFIAQLRRLHVSDKYRNKGIGRKLLETAIDTFNDIDLYGHASPNRIDNLDDDNFEKYRNNLKKLYNSVGLKSVGSGHRVERISNKLLNEGESFKSGDRVDLGNGWKECSIDMSTKDFFDRFYTDKEYIRTEDNYDVYVSHFKDYDEDEKEYFWEKKEIIKVERRIDDMTHYFVKELINRPLYKTRDKDMTREQELKVRMWCGTLKNPKQGEYIGHEKGLSMFKSYLSNSNGVLYHILPDGQVVEMLSDDIIDGVYLQRVLDYLLETRNFDLIPILDRYK